MNHAGMCANECERAEYAVMEGEPGAKRARRAGVAVVLGGQWGDEGKGKLVDILAQDADVVCRCQVGR